MLSAPKIVVEMHVHHLMLIEDIKVMSKITRELNVVKAVFKLDNTSPGNLRGNLCCVWLG